MKVFGKEIEAEVNVRSNVDLLKWEAEKKKEYDLLMKAREESWKKMVSGEH